MSEIHEKCLISFYLISFQLAHEIAEYLKTRQNLFYFSARYGRRAMFSNGEHRLCALGLSAAIKNHKDTF